MSDVVRPDAQLPTQEGSGGLKSLPYIGVQDTKSPPPERWAFESVAILPGQHAVEQLHIAAGGDVPAEVLLHIGLLQGAEAFPVVIVEV